MLLGALRQCHDNAKTKAGLRMTWQGGDGPREWHMRAAKDSVYG
jgi:hypothetical protein